MTTTKTELFTKGTVLLVRPQSLYSKLIAKSYKLVGITLPWTHVAIIGNTYVDEKTNIQYCVIYEAMGNGFRKRVKTIDDMVRYYLYGDFIPAKVKVPLDNLEDLCESYLGTPYGWQDILHIIVYRLTGSIVSSFSTKHQKMICSEAVVRILYSASNGAIDLETEYNKPADIITPVDIAKSMYITI